MTDGPGAAARPPRFHGRRHGRRLRPGRRAVLETALPRLRIPLPPSGRTLDPAQLFPASLADVWLEIGFGAGEHLAAMARAHPCAGLIGCEPFVNGVAAVVAAVERERLANVRVFDDDARLLLPHLPDACLGRVFVLFPDPWPKARHAERRIIGAETLDALARVMRAGAELRFASDHPLMVRWTLEHVTGHAAFDWCAAGPGDWRQRPADWPATRYEAKARARGARCTYLRFVRRGALRDGANALSHPAESIY